MCNGFPINHVRHAICYMKETSFNKLNLQRFMEFPESFLLFLLQYCAIHGECAVFLETRRGYSLSKFSQFNLIMF